MKILKIRRVTLRMRVMLIDRIAALWERKHPRNPRLHSIVGECLEPRILHAFGLDTSFSNDGWTTEDFGIAKPDYISDVAILANQKIATLGTANRNTGISDHNFVMSQFLPNGQLDSGYGVNGSRTIIFTDAVTIAPPFSTFNLDSVARAMALQSDQKRIAVGKAGSYFGVVRTDLNGNLDSTFATENQVFEGPGKALIPFSLASADAYDVAIGTNGKIVVAGEATANSGGTRTIAVARLNADGTYDLSFGSSGTVTTSFGFGDDSARSVVIQPDHKIIVAGTSRNANGQRDFAVVRYNVNGTLDTSFGINGKRSISFGASTFNEGRSIALQPIDGKILIGGLQSSASGSTSFGLARLTTSGALDSSFSGDGIATYSFGTSSYLNDIELQPDGKIIAAGQIGIGTGRTTGIIRFNTDGTRDTSFDRLFTDFTTKENTAGSIVLTSAGGILVAGSINHSSTNIDSLIAKFTELVAPTDILISNATAQENAAVGTNVGFFGSTDANPGNTFSYTLVSGTGSDDNSNFTVTGNVLKTNSVFNFEAKSGYSIRVRTTDQSGLFFEKVFSISIVNANEQPEVTLSQLSASLAEDTDTTSATELTTITIADDALGLNTLYLTGADAASFEIVANKLRLKAGVALDFEIKSSYSVRVNVDDNTIGTTPDSYVDFTLNITDIADSPSLTSVVVNGGDVFLNSAQRSQITSLVVTFSVPVVLSSNPFSIVNIGLVTAQSPVAIDPSQILVTGSGTTYTIRFGAGAGVTARDNSTGFGRGNSLVDGNFLLTINASQVKDLAEVQTLAAINSFGDGDNEFGDRSVDNFFRLFGDSNGDGLLSSSDTAAFRSAFSTGSASLNNAAFDWDGDGIVSNDTNSLDRINFLANTRIAKRRRINF